MKFVPKHCAARRKYYGAVEFRARRRRQAPVLVKSGKELFTFDNMVGKNIGVIAGMASLTLHVVGVALAVGPLERASRFHSSVSANRAENTWGVCEAVHTSFE
jgi:hypothetical protein